jgi:hypothetical protein
VEVGSGTVGGVGSGEPGAAGVRVGVGWVTGVSLAVGVGWATGVSVTVGGRVAVGVSVGLSTSVGVGVSRGELGYVGVVSGESNNMERTLGKAPVTGVRTGTGTSGLKRATEVAMGEANSMGQEAGLSAAYCSSQGSMTR